VYFLPIPTFSSDHQEKKNEEKKMKKKSLLSEIYSTPKILNEKKLQKLPKTTTTILQKKTIPKQAK